LTDASLLELSRKVEYQVDEKISLRDVTRGSLFVHMGGQIHSEHIVHALGHPDVPLTPESFRTKFDDCVKQIGAQWALTHSEQLWNKLWALRSSSDVRDLTQLLHISKEI
jgi:2-methylcitrate dehydratase PrpD